MSIPEIHFHLEMDGFILRNPEHSKNWLKSVISNEKKEVSALNYIFCSDEYLLEINREYLDHDFYTDIISFPLKSDPIEGDIFISVERVLENAKEYQVESNQELHRVMVHGLLHFLGYDDHEEKDILQMREKEDFYLKEWND